MKKLIFASILFLGFTFSGFAQSEKQTVKINEKIDKLEAKFGDESLKLSEEQRAKIFELFVQKNKELKVLKKELDDKEKFKEAQKPIHKKYAKLINPVLTKEQKAARKANRAKNKK